MSTKQNTHHDIEKFLKVVEESWSSETSADPENWDENNRAWGQCAVTAAMVQNEFGGEIVRVMYQTPEKNASSHYFNILSDCTRVDGTLKQFPKGTVFFPSLDENNEVLKETTQQYLHEKGFEDAGAYILSGESTARRYQILQNRASVLRSEPPQSRHNDHTLER